MLLLHMGYGIGSFIVPLYANPFLAVPHPTSATNCTAGINETTLTTFDCRNTTETLQQQKYTRETRIQYPYAISAILIAVFSIAFFVLQVLHIKKVKSQRKRSNVASKVERVRKHSGDNRTFKEMINPATCAGGRFWYGIQLFSLLIFFFANINGGERMIASFLRSYSIDQLGFTIDEGSFINTTFWISFTAGRLVFFILARWISIRILIMIEFGGVLLIGVLMNIFARTSGTAFWVLVQPLGLFVAPCYPSGVAWTDFHMEFTGLGMTVIILGGAMGGFVHLRLLGYLYENLGFHTYLYQILGYGVFGLVMCIILTLVGSQHGSRFVKEGEESSEQGEMMLEKKL